MSTNASSMIGIKQRATPPLQTTAETMKSNTNEYSSNISAIYRITRDLVSFFCRRIIFAPAIFKIIVYFLIVIIGSSLNSMGLAPRSYLSSKTNIFNIYFVKFGWGWTIGLLLPFVYLNLHSIHTTHRQIIVYHLSRLLIATGFWYIITFLFVSIESYTGMCKHPDYASASRKVCLKNGHKWQEGHDFSGHTFLLIYALLIMNEEVKLYDQDMKRLQKSATMENGTTANNASGDVTTNTGRTCISMVIQVVYIALALLTVIWEFMLLSTALYFHEMLHKFGAAVLAVACWWLTYHLWYLPNSSSMYRPSLPKN